MTTAGEPTAPRDLREHLALLKERGLLVTIDEPINKDTQLHPLVRWQFTGGLADNQRRAFLFTNVVGADGRKFDTPVLVGGLAASPDIYATGLGVKVEDIGDVWTRGIDRPIPPIKVETGVCQEVVVTGEDLRKPGGGLAALPIPISTPGFDSAPYFTATLCVTKDPENGIRNMGTYRGGLKATDRVGVRMATRLTGAGGYQHWLKYKERGEPMPIAIVIGAAPVVQYTGPQKLAIDDDEMAVAGGLAGAALRVCKCKTVDLEIPADAEFVIEGLIDTDYVEPEGPFGESHGYIALEEFNMSMRVTAITHRKNPIFVSVVSQVTPSESSVMKRVAYEPLYFQHLKKVLNVKGISGVSCTSRCRTCGPSSSCSSSAARSSRKSGADCRARRPCRRSAARSSSPSPTTSTRATRTRCSGRWPIGRTRSTISWSCPIARARTVPRPRAARPIRRC